MGMGNDGADVCDSLDSCSQLNNSEIREMNSGKTTGGDMQSNNAMGNAFGRDSIDSNVHLCVEQREGECAIQESTNTNSNININSNKNIDNGPIYQQDANFLTQNVIQRSRGSDNIPLSPIPVMADVDVDEKITTLVENEDELSPAIGEDKDMISKDRDDINNDRVKKMSTVEYERIVETDCPSEPPSIPVFRNDSLLRVSYLKRDWGGERVSDVRSVSELQETFHSLEKPVITPLPRPRGFYDQWARLPRCDVYQRLYPRVTSGGSTKCWTLLQAIQNDQSKQSAQSQSPDGSPQKQLLAPPPHPSEVSCHSLDSIIDHYNQLLQHQAMQDVIRTPSPSSTVPSQRITANLQQNPNRINSGGRSSSSSNNSNSNNNTNHNNISNSTITTNNTNNTGNNNDGIINNGKPSNHLINANNIMYNCNSNIRKNANKKSSALKPDNGVFRPQKVRLRTSPGLARQTTKINESRFSLPSYNIKERSTMKSSILHDPDGDHENIGLDTNRQATTSQGITAQLSNDSETEASSSLQQHAKNTALVSSVSQTLIVSHKSIVTGTVRHETSETTNSPIVEINVDHGSSQDNQDHLETKTHTVIQVEDSSLDFITKSSDYNFCTVTPRRLSGPTNSKSISRSLPFERAQTVAEMNTSKMNCSKSNVIFDREDTELNNRLNAGIQKRHERFPMRSTACVSRSKRVNTQLDFNYNKSRLKNLTRSIRASPQNNVNNNINALRDSLLIQEINNGDTDNNNNNDQRKVEYPLQRRDSPCRRIHYSRQKSKPDLPNRMQSMLEHNLLSPTLHLVDEISSDRDQLMTSSGINSAVSLASVHFLDLADLKNLLKRSNTSINQI